MDLPFAPLGCDDEVVQVLAVRLPDFTFVPRESGPHA